jgi:hypothetical protein
MCSPAGEAALSVDVGDHPTATVWRVEVRGERDGTPTTVVLEAHLGFDPSGPDPGAGTAGSVASPPRGRADITAVPAARFVQEVLHRRFTVTGVSAPEGGIEPGPFVTAALAELGAPLVWRVGPTEAGSAVP